MRVGTSRTSHGSRYTTWFGGSTGPARLVPRPSLHADRRGTKERQVVDEDHLPRYARSGQGEEPVLLLHGIGHRRQLWRPVVDRLLDRFELVTVDLPGFGESAPSAMAEPSPEWLADRIESLMDSLD